MMTHDEKNLRSSALYAYAYKLTHMRKLMRNKLRLRDICREMS